MTTVTRKPADVFAALDDATAVVDALPHDATDTERAAARDGYQAATAAMWDLF